MTPKREIPEGVRLAIANARLALVKPPPSALIKPEVIDDAWSERADLD